MPSELKTRPVPAGSNPHDITIDEWLAPNAPAWVCNEVVRLREEAESLRRELETWKAEHGDNPSLWPAWKRAAAARVMPYKGQR